MAWNQPGSSGQDRDPWGSGSNGSNSGGNNSGGNNSGGNNNKGGRGQRPPDLDALLRKLGKKLSSLAGIGVGTSNGNPSLPAVGNQRIIGIAVAMIVMIWFASGIYRIEEADRGVVTRLGKLSHIVTPGLNWRPRFIDEVRIVDVKVVRELAAAGVMLTSDENVVRIEMNVQYRVDEHNPAAYLFSVTNPDDSLRQATDSAVRGVIGKYTMDKILTEGRTVVRSDTQRVLEETIRPYNMGIILTDVNFQAARPPEEVKAAFDDAIAARENEQQYIREAEAYTNEVQPRANGQAQRLLEDARAYKSRTILEAQGEVASFARLLPEYKAAPQITRERLYIEAMENVLSHTRKVLVNDKSNSLMVLPLDQLLRKQKSVEKSSASGKNIASPPSEQAASQNHDLNKADAIFQQNIVEQRRTNVQRDNTTRVGRE